MIQSDKPSKIATRNPHRYEMLLRGDAATLAASVTEALADLAGSPLAQIAPVDLEKSVRPKVTESGIALTVTFSRGGTGNNLVVAVYVLAVNRPLPLYIVLKSVFSALCSVKKCRTIHTI